MVSIWVCIMMYKFCDANHVNVNVQGRLRFGRLLRYRLLEIATGDCWIGDKHEGCANTIVNAKFGNSGGDDDLLRRNLARSGVSIGVGAGVTLKDVPITSEIDAFICSFSMGVFQDIHNVMCRSPDRVNYSGAFRVIDPELLVQRVRDGVLDTGEVVSARYDVRHGPVSYESTEHVYEGEIVKGDPFRKNPKFSMQSEWRLALIGRDKLLGQDEFVNIDCKNLFEIVETDHVNNEGYSWLESDEALKFIEKECRSERRSDFDPGWLWRQDNMDLVRAYLAIRRGEDSIVDAACLLGAPRGHLLRALSVYMEKEYGILMPQHGFDLFDLAKQFT